LPNTAIWQEPAFNYAEITDNRAVDLRGYFQSERYFLDGAPLVRRLFSPRPEIARRVETILRQLENRRPLCSVHVRRGDYLEGNAYVRLAENGYYDRTIRFFPPNTTFVVCSDNLEFCRRKFCGPSFVFIDGVLPIVDLLVMSGCDAHIVANSTFSWWSAWLDAREDKTVLAPRRWFGSDHNDSSQPFRAGPPYSGFFDETDLFPESWIRL
jgi:hypothetical protein